MTYEQLAQRTSIIAQRAMAADRDFLAYGAFALAYDIHRACEGATDGGTFEREIWESALREIARATSRETTREEQQRAYRVIYASVAHVLGERGLQMRERS